MMAKTCERCGEPIDSDDEYFCLDAPGVRLWCCAVCHDDLEAMNDDEITDELYGNAGATRKGSANA